MSEIRPTTSATLELELRPDFAAALPTGALLTADGKRRPFSGWLELASAIEDWRQTYHCDQPTQETTR